MPAYLGADVDREIIFPVEATKTWNTVDKKYRHPSIIK